MALKGLFIHDFKYLRYKKGFYGDGQFEYENLWKKKYLSFFDELTVAARGRETDDKAEVVSKYRLDGHHVNFISTDSSSSVKRLLNTGKVRGILIHAIDNSDVVIVRLPSIQGIIACSILETKDKPYVIEVAGSAFESLWYHDNIKGKIVAPIVQFLTKRHIGRAKNVMYVTNNYLQKQYPNTNNTIACSDVLITNTSPVILKKRLKKISQYNDSTTYKLGLVGSYDVLYKGHDTAIKAVSKLSKKYKVELHFLGSGSKEKWVQLAKTYGIASNLFFDSPLNAGPEMLGWLDEIDVLLIPSKTEGMPRVMLEAMSRAEIIIASDVGDIPYVLDENSIQQSSDWNAYAGQIVSLLGDKELMSNCAKTNFAKAKQYTIGLLSTKRDAYMFKIINLSK